MEEAKYGLGEAGLNLDLTKPMRSRISDTLVPPPVQENMGAASSATTPVKYDPKVIAEKIWTTLMSTGASSEFEVRFHLRNGKGFILRGDKEGFGSVQPVEQFMEVHERLLEVYHKEVTKVDIFTGDMAMTFSSYNDLLEWLEM
ncbi:MAG: hypothetical protein AAB275_08480 [Deltaproteobacteria bacterium]